MTHSDDPLTDSPDEHETLCALAMSLIPGIGPRVYSALLNHFETPSNVLRQSEASLASVPGIGPSVASRICGQSGTERAREMMSRCRELNVDILQRTAVEYPRPLAQIPDAPGILYCRGELLAQDELALAIVGSRRCTVYGRRQAERLGASLARAGFTIVSGLARGIDGAAHRGALNAGGRTFAVMATGVREIYPHEHADLALEIVRSGALLSEFPLDQKPRPGLFPQRNRIISGLSLGVIVVEATRKSGALYTARHAMEQGREVFAVPGAVDSLASDGCHELIRDGVTLVRNADDVIQGLGPMAQPATTTSITEVHNPREMTLNPQEKEVLNLIGTSAVPIDDVLRTTQLDPSRALSTITVLEMKRLIRRLPGNMLVRNT